MSGSIVVINPNSNQAVTDGLDAALAPFRLEGAPAIECVTLTEGPFGIESQLHSDQVVLPLARLVEARSDAAAFVIACYSDPGIDACRAISPVPVFGIQESGVLAALARADRIGIVAISDASERRHRLYMRRMGVSARIAGERALNMSVDESARGAGTFDRLLEVGGALIGDGAEALVLGCAGLATHRTRLEAALGLPVIDPTQAAVADALGAVLAARL
ncbi:aspartate/glutamate racemase family protein [Jannaschia seohaensis]|uniref:Asp/Glu/hydantoin racemase n=1 Tax=Jannaschia seohaensis TaxID=475081 RepID=A0A2Y9AG77_9RHOB|nr:aspartate/glutamate racemase family protein [Jannaschia seohaensis]PWJ20917.1 Asp/Glu/hydantoin racemase [Jannaschia seohaensis]SSA41327.1 Asp/Glu/hydantoin racemase [Jannaschia seohaensis]